MTMPKKKEADDLPTPQTDKLIDDMLQSRGIPQCWEWERLAAHAREMERLVATFRAIVVAELKDARKK